MLTLNKINKTHLIILGALIVITALLNFFALSSISGTLDILDQMTYQINFGYLLLQILGYASLVSVFGYIIYLLNTKVDFSKKQKVEKTKTASPKETITQKQPLQQGTVLEFKQEEVKIVDIKSKNKYTAGESVVNGYYLEIDQNYMTSNRIVNVTTSILPKLANPTNSYVGISKEEKTMLSLTNVNFEKFIKKTPGSFTEGGYFVEVDLDNKSTEYYIFTEKRLPPTSAKGFRWVKVENRKIVS